MLHDTMVWASVVGSQAYKSKFSWSSDLYELSSEKDKHQCGLAFLFLSKVPVHSFYASPDPNFENFQNVHV